MIKAVFTSTIDYNYDTTMIRARTNLIDCKIGTVVIKHAKGVSKKVAPLKLI